MPGAPDDGTLGRWHNRGRAGATRQTHLRPVIIAVGTRNEAHVDVTGPVNLHAGEKRGVKFAARGQIEQVGERHAAAGVREQRRVYGRARQVFGLRIGTARDVQIDEFGSVQPFGQ